jgi:hypothetical protein
MSIPVPYAAQPKFHGGRHITRRRPLIKWRLAISQLMIAGVVRSLQQVPLLISLLTSAA